MPLQATREAGGAIPALTLLREVRREGTRHAMRNEMNREWRQLECLFFCTVALPPAERRALLADLCPHDPALQREVESLIRADAAAPPYLRRLVARAMAELRTVPMVPLPRQAPASRP